MFDLRTEFLGKFAAAIVANPDYSPMATADVMEFALELAIAAEQTAASYDPLLAEQLKKDSQTAEAIRQQLARQEAEASAPEASAPEESPNE